ncbi:hypothetical protein DNH61_10610 [Paenibacillus sambharensis]|uniref:Uncharacterized protein n=1 Tax=Paenibacillus sambharensis TaxID=1803190 RepID=A0A2W1L6Q7_9BACL|nr:hypothetical protein [Paenibacillus sambharensis]PZD95888.1 hypothetical protein DNH61_10610 [Paenibacillus sambharensis]
MSFILFMLFSVIESIALFSLTLSLFRLKFKQYFWPALILNILINLTSFFMRKSPELTEYAPIAILLLLILFLVTVVRIPVLWSVVVAFTGYLSVVLVQTGVMLLSFGFLSVDEISAFPWKGYLLQTMTGIIGYTAAMTLYKRGLGFSFEFNRVGFGWGTIILISVLFIIAIGIGSVLFINNLLVAAVIFFIGLAFLLYYAVKKERSNGDFGL